MRVLLQTSLIRIHAHATHNELVCPVILVGRRFLYCGRSRVGLREEVTFVIDTRRVLQLHVLIISFPILAC